MTSLTLRYLYLIVHIPMPYPHTSAQLSFITVKVPLPHTAHDTGFTGKCRSWRASPLYHKQTKFSDASHLSEYVSGKTLDGKQR